MTKPDPEADCSWAEGAQWVNAWDGLVAAVGEELEEDTPRPAADPIEMSAVRRYLEPLEFGCPLHSDPEIARAQGYANVVAPYSGLATWGAAALWRPNDPPFWIDASRNALPTVRGVFPPPAPLTNAAFLTDLDQVFLRSIVVGDHLSMVGRRLLACRPKQTRVGRGAFITLETRVLDSSGDVVAYSRPTAYFYVAGAGVGGTESD